MKKAIYTLALTVLSLVGVACQSAQSGKVPSTTPISLAGEWDIVSANDTAITQTPLPFIGFDTAEQRVYGSSGCNRFMGQYTLTANDSLDLGALASTRMLCEDMATEDLVLRALNGVKKVAAGATADELVLQTESGQAALRLRKRAE